MPLLQDDQRTAAQSRLDVLDRRRVAILKELQEINSESIVLLNIINVIPIKEDTQ